MSHAVMTDEMTGCLLHGQIRVRREDQYVVELMDGRAVNAVRGAGCLLEPEAQDTALVYLGPDGARYIVSILEKHGQTSRLSAPGKLVVGHDEACLRLDGPVARLEADESVQLISHTVRTNAVSTVIDAVRARLSCHQFEIAAQKATAGIGQVRTVIASLVSRLRSSHRHVDGPDTHHARTMRLSTDTQFILNAESARMQSEKDMTIDGESIHLG
ncbi:DUF3540 domain-containing protein [Desulfovibrio inopinatus]|uniref:DUF3540 domain-containing protein n=1 Tax=Desulfovibrio inopinatus TaxID=102109 RepID=UPI0003F994D2|nr:DUF3540 domain-containing protein [Desulfovibrio inopinatus]